MSGSATVTYSAVSMGGVFNYEVLLHNTSPMPFDIYSFLFGWQYEVPMTGTFPLQNIVLIGAPPGWAGFLEQMDISWGTSFQGSSIASGYIMPGQSGTFIFQSTTPPPATLPFGCCFYNNANEWGFCFNGTAKNELGLRKPPYFAIINPLVLILGDELFARLNLPRPLPLTRSLREQLAPGIQSMIPAQRETAARAVDAYITALTEVRAALKAQRTGSSAPTRELEGDLHR